MPRNQAVTEIRQRMKEFTNDLVALFEEANQAALAQASRNSAPARRSASTSRGPKRTAKPGGARRAAKLLNSRGPGAKAGTTGRPGRPPLQSESETARLMERISKYLSSHPNTRLEEIGSSLKTNTKDLKRPIFLLMEAGRLSTTGQRRGMRYRLR
jgi:uncharacterized protein (DUF2164 family)